MLTSSIPFNFADVPNNELTPVDDLSTVSSTPNEIRSISISLNESVGLSTNSPQKKNLAENPSILSTSETFGKVVYLSENLEINSSMLEQTVQLNSFVVQPQTTFDRVS